MSRTFRNRPEECFYLEGLPEYKRFNDWNCKNECCSQKARRKLLGNSKKRFKNNIFTKITCMKFLRKHTEPLTETSNYHQHLRYLGTVDMPLDLYVSAVLAQMYTFAIPSISSLLHKTEEFEKRGMKRLDDTRAIMTECLDEGVNSKRGQIGINRLNQIHSQYSISNKDFLFTLSLFMTAPNIWCNTFAYRSLTAYEKECFYQEFKKLGINMGIKEIPESYIQIEEWQKNFMKKYMKYSESNKIVNQAFINSIVKVFPNFIEHPIKFIVYRTLPVLVQNDELLEALGMEKPSKSFSFCILFILKTKAFFETYVNIWQIFDFTSSFLYKKYLSYPNGYSISMLGPSRN